MRVESRAQRLARPRGSAALRCCTLTADGGSAVYAASERMLQARHYICNSEGSLAAAVEAEPGGVVPSERAEIQVRSDRATGAGELVKFGELAPHRPFSASLRNSSG